MEAGRAEPAMSYSNTTARAWKIENQENGIMPKIKTNRSAAKRFHKTGSGKYTFAKSHHSHILTKKTTKRKRSLRQMQLIKASDMREVRRLLPNG